MYKYGKPTGEGSNKSDDAGEDALDYENPPPASNSRFMARLAIRVGLGGTVALTITVTQVA
jgi:hypothetical protein